MRVFLADHLARPACHSGNLTVGPTRILCTPPPSLPSRRPVAAAAAPTRSHGSGRELTSKPPHIGRTASTSPLAGAVAAYKERTELSALPTWPHTPSPPGTACPGPVEETVLSIANWHSG